MPKIGNEINILVTLDSNYIPYLNVMLFSLMSSNPDEYFRVFLLNNKVEKSDVESSEKILGDSGTLKLVKIKETELDAAPTTDRYPKEIYYRIFAAKYLPQDIERVLYLDPDLIVNNGIRALYDMDMGNNYFAAASHIGGVLHFINEIRLDMGEESPYINSGVMLMNLAQLRKEQRFEEVFEYIRNHKSKLILPDQDIISGLYGDRIIALDPFKYNMTERLFAFRFRNGGRSGLKDVRENAVIIHYCGRNKPWKNNYVGRLNVFYDETVKRMNPEDADN